MSSNLPLTPRLMVALTQEFSDFPLTTRQTAEAIAKVVNALVDENVLQLVPEPPVVFNPREIETLENLCQNSAISAMQAWVFVRPEVRPSHGELIQLGRQLSVRYPGLIKRGPTRYYRITKQVKGATVTPDVEAMQRPS